jgi:hypothetical protein
MMGDRPTYMTLSPERMHFQNGINKTIQFVKGAVRKMNQPHIFYVTVML